jgi:hypothetical protein
MSDGVLFNSLAVGYRRQVAVWSSLQRRRRVISVLIGTLIGTLIETSRTVRAQAPELDKLQFRLRRF